eukprot:TRINITY_DN17323_c1_g1_i2.p1 TRINITY_DN17323_c1_g1~~TRINITY_DN17323_c1_g1_i2.p1  ORF type:complete len:328 (+),score=54.30 TRINITY_DN17323_c1_g1_i2:72-1055(+)
MAMPMSSSPYPASAPQTQSFPNASTVIPNQMPAGGIPMSSSLNAGTSFHGVGIPAGAIPLGSFQSTPPVGPAAGPAAGPASRMPAGSIPLPGLTSGMLPSGMNYNQIPKNAPLYADFPPSPLQQWIRASPSLPGNSSVGHGLGFEDGTPVRVFNLTSPSMSAYNGIVGDIVEVHTIDDGNTIELLFDVKCPCTGQGHKPNPRIVPDPRFAKFDYSTIAKMNSPMNRKKLASVFGVTEAQAMSGEDIPKIPPFVILNKLPTEKLEPLGDSEAQGAYGVPKKLNPPIIGPPLTQAEMARIDMSKMVNGAALPKGITDPNRHLDKIFQRR